MVLSRRTLKRMKNLESICDFDTENRVATLNLNLQTVSEIIDEKRSNADRPYIKPEAIGLIENGLELVPKEFKVDIRITVIDSMGYDSQTIQNAFTDAVKTDEYMKKKGNKENRSRKGAFVLVGLLMLLIVVFNAKNNWFAPVGFSFAAIIAFILELIFEVYFEQGISHFVVSRIYERFGYTNRIGKITFII